MRVFWSRARRLVAVGLVAGSIGVFVCSFVTGRSSARPVLAAGKTLGSEHGGCSTAALAVLIEIWLERILG